MNRAFFITFEGGEGCGKTTHSNLFCEYLTKQGYSVIHTREPGGTELSEAIRELVKNPKYSDKSDISELLLFEASRTELCQKIILPSLKENKIVVVDRFYDSTTAYQGYARGMDIDNIKYLNKLATNGLEPDLTFYLKIDPEIAFRRKGGADNDSFEQQTLEFHKRVSAGFNAIAKECSYRFAVIDSNREQSVVQSDIQKAFEEKYAR